MAKYWYMRLFSGWPHLAFRGSPVGDHMRIPSLRCWGRFRSFMASAFKEPDGGESRGLQLFTCVSPFLAYFMKPEWLVERCPLRSFYWLSI